MLSRTYALILIALWMAATLAGAPDAHAQTTLPTSVNGMLTVHGSLIVKGPLAVRGEIRFRCGKLNFEGGNIQVYPPVDLPGHDPMTVNGDAIAWVSLTVNGPLRVDEALTVEAPPLAGLIGFQSMTCVQ